MTTNDTPGHAMGPLSISVIIPAFRAERTIRRAIDSVLAQTIPPSSGRVRGSGTGVRLSTRVTRSGHPSRFDIQMLVFRFEKARFLTMKG